MGDFTNAVNNILDMKLAKSVNEAKKALENAQKIKDMNDKAVEGIGGKNGKK